MTEPEVKNCAAKYKYLFDNNPQPMWVYDLETLQFLDVNNAALHQYGYTKDEFLSMTIKDIRPTEDVSVLMKNIANTSDVLDNSGLWRHRKKSGEIIFVQVTSHLIDYDERKARLVLANDVTESRLAREELELVNNQLTNLYNNLPEAVFSYDTIKGKMLQVSQSHEEIFGYSPEEFFKNSRLWYEIVLPEDRHVIDEGVLVLNSGKVRVNQYRIMRPDGEIRWVEAKIKPILDESEQLIRTDGIVADITARKKAETDLHTSRLQLTNAMEVARMGHWEYDVLNDLFTFNDQFYKLLRTTVEEVGSYCLTSSDYASRFIHPDDIHMGAKEIQAAIEIPEPHFSRELEHRIIYPDGETGFLLVKFTVVKDIKRKTIKTFGVSQDITHRKKIEEEFKKSQIRFRKLIENAPDGISLVTEDGKFKYNSPAAYKIFGYNPETLVETVKPEELTHHEDLPKVYKAFRTVINNPSKIITIRYRFKHIDGSWHWIESTFTNLLQEPSVEAIVINYKDITQQELAEEELKLSESKYRNLFDNANDAILIFEPENEIVLEVNNKACEMYNIKREKFIGLSLKSITRDLKAGQKKIKETIDNDSYKNFESRQYTSDGRCLDLLINASVIEFNGKPAILSINRDITNRKKRDENIKLLSKSIEQSQVSVVITDPMGTIQYVNPKFTKLTGFTSEEAIGRGIDIMQSDFHPTEYFENIWNTILSGKDWHGELLVPKKNGETYWENAVISPIINEEGKITNIIGVKEDITEKKKMIEELISSKEKAEEASHLKSNFLANMSHELRTPLIGILGFAELLASEISDNEHFEMINNILRSGKRLMDTLNSILDISRIEANRHDIILEPVNLNDILIETINLFKPLAKEKGLSLNLIAIDEIPLINSDKDLLLKIFNNLISNAVKYTEQGGVSVRISADHIRPMEMVTVNVIDSGIGISKENQRVIFEPFRQVSEGLSRKFEGAGLGLSITKKFVEMLNGSISVESEPLSGSTFTVKFPLPADKIDESSLPVNEKIRSVSEKPETNYEKRILLVEDDHMNAAVIKSFLKDYIVVDHVLTGTAAIDNCKVIKYDVILMDINLKDINGIESLHLIRKINDFYSRTPVVALTAYAMKGDKEKFLSEGFNYYLSKPFRRKDLISLISEVFV